MFLRNHFHENRLEDCCTIQYYCTRRSSRLMHVREQKRDRRIRTSLVVRVRIRNSLRRLFECAIIFMKFVFENVFVSLIWFCVLLESYRNDLKSHVVIFASSRFEFIDVCKNRCNHDIRLTIASVSHSVIFWSDCLNKVIGSAKSLLPKR